MPLDEASAIVRRLREAGHEAFLVGGCVRDLIRGVTPQDFDIVTSARPEEVQPLFARTVPVGARFGVVLVIEEGYPYEVATFRVETGYDDGRHPSQVAFATAEEDVRRRDFTINGLLMDPETGPGHRLRRRPYGHRPPPHPDDRRPGRAFLRGSSADASSGPLYRHARICA